MRKIKYYVERLYPYVVAIVVICVMKKFKLNFIENDNLNSALDGVATIAALIMGFLGAILPVILGMKNESKFVKYVFECDEKMLFLKYIKATISSGLMLVSLTIVMYFSNAFKEKAQIIGFYIWTYFIVLFLLCTYRSLTNMLNLIFTKDSNLTPGRYKNNDQQKTEEEKDLEEKYSLEKEE